MFSVRGSLGTPVEIGIYAVASVTCDSYITIVYDAIFFFVLANAGASVVPATVPMFPSLAFQNLSTYHTDGVMNNTNHHDRSGMNSLTAHLRQWLFFPLFAVVVTLTAACDSSTSSNDAGRQATPISIAFTTNSSSGSPALLAKRIITDPNGNELEFTRIELILEEVEFERAESSDACRSEDDDDDLDDDCEEIERGPFAVSLPLSGTDPLIAFEADIPVGEWEEVEFEVEPRNDDDTGLSTNVPVDRSILVEGTWTPSGGAPTSFSWTSDLDAEQEIQFSPPLSITADAPVNVTFRFGIDTWFRDGSGNLIDPTQVDDDLEEQIEENIEASIEGYRDDDLDGDDDSGDDDSGDDDSGDDDSGDDDSGDDDSGDDDSGDDDSATMTTRTPATMTRAMTRRR